LTPEHPKNNTVVATTVIHPFFISGASADWPILYGKVDVNPASVTARD
jgi:hypothetical protein